MAVSPLFLRIFRADNKKPIPGANRRWVFQEFADQFRGAIAIRGPLLMGGATTKSCADRSDSWGGEYRQAAKLPSRLMRINIGPLNQGAPHAATTDFFGF